MQSELFIPQTIFICRGSYGVVSKGHVAIQHRCGPGSFFRSLTYSITEPLFLLMHIQSILHMLCDLTSVYMET